jgi:pyruvate/2-oxoglutarate dehydrogenase complex dihydrolipoamide dehydrogenase (E3) component
MSNLLKCDVCIIGAGPGGLSIATAANTLGASVVLIEENKMGGDCLNVGRVPLTSLIESARLVNRIKNAAKFGVPLSTPDINYAYIHQHTQEVITAIAPEISAEHLSKLGIIVLHGHGQFIDQQTVSVGEQKVKAKYFIIATGSKPAIPPILGLESVKFFTSATIVECQEKPQRLLVIGGGAIGCEIAQAYAMLGTPVTLIDVRSILPHDDQQFVEMIRQQLVANNIDLLENIKISQVKQQGAQITVHFTQGNISREVTGSHLFIATGRRANIGKLNLTAANIVFNEQAIEVDTRLRTSNKKVFAIGSVVGKVPSPHNAKYQASIIIKNVLFKYSAKISDKIIPWVTYTTPELAQVGLTEQQAREKNMKIKITIENFVRNDRAQMQYQTNGAIKVITDMKANILGVSIIGTQAGELIFPWILAMQHGLSIKQMAKTIAPYPTLNDINKRVAMNYFIPLYSSKWMRLLVKLLKIFD